MEKLISASFIILALTACGQKPVTAVQNTTPKGACNYANDGYCNEYYGGSIDKKWIDENNCKPLKTTVIDKCPTEKALTRCVFDTGTFQERHMLIYKQQIVATHCSAATGGVKKAP